MTGTAVNVSKILIGTFGFLCLLVSIQMIASRYNERLDLTIQQKFTLSPRSQKILSELKEDVLVMAFVQSDRPENFFLEDLLGRMQDLSPRFQYNIIDM